MQRFFDIVFALGALVILSPILAFICLILKFSGEGEVFYLQTRIGKNGEDFKIYKFATMLKNSERMGTGTITVKDDPRVLPVGKFLRKTKLNELPQLVNILIGEMSIIGPRPQDRRCFEAFKSEHKNIIKTCVPGLSGLGSIFFRDEENLLANSKDADFFYDEIIMPYKGQLEVWFAQNNNLLIYFGLIFITIVEVILPSKLNLFFVFKSLPQVPDEIVELRRGVSS